MSKPGGWATAGDASRSEPEKVGPECHQLAGCSLCPEVRGRVPRQGMVPGKRLTPRAKGAAPHKHSLGFEQAPRWAPSAARLGSAEAQKWWSSTLGQQLSGARSLRKIHTHRDAPLGEEDLFVFLLVEAGIREFLVTLGCHRPLAVLT